MSEKTKEIFDTGERILPTEDGEISFVFSRHKFAYKSIQKYVKDKTVIDIGCGTGYGSYILAEQAKTVLGIDNNIEAITYCKHQFSASNIDYIQMDGSSLKLNQQFDIAVTFQAIEHFVDLDGFIDQLKHVVKPNGTIYISTPNVRKSQKETSKNPYHFNDMNYTQFKRLISGKFTNFELMGVAYASKNKFRSILGKTPFYKWGRIFKRKSGIKKIANKVMDLSSFKIINSNLEDKAADFLVRCVNE